jgi:hypothetical protein
MDVIGFGAINLDSIYSVSLGPPPADAGNLAAGFLAGLLLGLDPERCAILGTEAAAKSITGYGRSSYPGPELLAGVRTERGSP